MRRVLMMVNPVSSARRLRRVPAVRAALEAAGVAVEMEETSPVRSVAAARARMAAESGVDAVLVCGGDGTVFDVLQGLAGTAVPIGVLPFGTGNVLVQNLGLPRDPVAAVRALLQAEPLEVPLGRIVCGGESLYFAMAAGVGGHAVMMRAAHNYWKPRTGRLAYFAAGMEVLARHRLVPFALEVETVDGERRERLASELIAVRVGELNLWRTGGGLRQGWLRVASVEGVSRLRLARASAESLLLGAGSRGGEVQGAAIYENARRLRISVAGDTTLAGQDDQAGRATLALEADGEMVAQVTAATPAVIEMAGVSAVLLTLRA